MKTAQQSRQEKIMNYLKLSTIKKAFLFFTMMSFLSLSYQAPVYAGMVGTEEISQSAQLELKRDDLRNLMARADVRLQLLEMGVSEQDVDQRIENLTAGEINSLHSQFDDLPAGEGFLGAVIAIIVIFMLLDLAGATDVFPGI